MSPLLRMLGPAMLIATGVVLLTLAVLTFSPVFVAVPLAACCALVVWVGLRVDSVDPGVVLSLHDDRTVPGLASRSDR